MAFISGTQKPPVSYMMPFWHGMEQQLGNRRKKFLVYKVYMERSFTNGCDVITRALSTAISCILGHFRHGEEQTLNQPDDPRASLLLTTEKAVFCNIVHHFQVLSTISMGVGAF